jgi:site-specific DNA recombinase
MRKRPRSEWKIIERPQMRIVSDELWERTQAARKEIREAVAPKRQLARGKSGKHHSPSC